MGKPRGRKSLPKMTTAEAKGEVTDCVEETLGRLWKRNKRSEGAKTKGQADGIQWRPRVRTIERGKRIK